MLRDSYAAGVLDIPIVQLDKDLPLPGYAKTGDAGVDLLAAQDLVVEPGCRAVVRTGIAIAIPEGYAGFVQPRSGLALKKGITVLNSPGLIDSGYRNEVGVILINTSNEDAFDVHRGDRIAQLVIQRVEQCRFIVCDELPVDLSDEARGLGGFGHTGVGHAQG